MQKFPGEDLYIDRRERVYKPFLGLNYRPVRERVYDFREAIEPFDIERAQYEASRCIHCPDPAPCHAACPVHNDIPSALWLIEKGKFIEAAQLFRETSSMPEICGRVCPQEQLCEGSCVLEKPRGPVLIGALEFFVTDYEHLHLDETIHTAAPSGKKVAVIGGGPSGLACAEKLIRFGHAVTVFDRRPMPGGLLIYGIPGFKLSNKVFLNKLNRLVQAGIQFKNNICIGEEKTIDNLLDEGFDAIYIGVGAGVDVPLGIPGENLPGVYQGIDFLIRANVDKDHLPTDMTSKPEIGSRVIIIGGGDTSSDCLRTALRLGAKNVTCVYRRSEKEMPGVLKDRKMAHQEGAQYLFQSQPIRFLAGKDGKLNAAECIRMRLGEPDEKGRRRPIPIEDSNFMLEAETAILALGYYPYPTIASTTPGLNTHKGDLITTDPVTGATSRQGIYAGGDAVRGPNLVVNAIADGQRAAASINNYLKDQ